jgi:methionyl-tRNA formyltransferase
MKIGVIGSVSSTEITFRTLVDNGFEVVGVLGYRPLDISNVSGWVDLKHLSADLGILYRDFQNINDQSHIDWMRELQPDVIFAVGFSQLLSDEWLTVSSLGCIGFHPTFLPRGRGRAPLAWIVLEERIGAATFFLMGQGADDGPIFIQEPFMLEDNDDASSVGNKITLCIEKALKKWLPDLKQGKWEPIPQEERLATWYGKRSPSDGLINWNQSAENINRLIKASTSPHPGAYTFHKDQKIIIWNSQIEYHIPIKGVIGRVLLSKNSQYLVQCMNSLIWIKNISGVDKLRVGDKLGYDVEQEIYFLKNKIKNIE